ncbi:glycosyltransferase [Prosthecobacter sp.]|uniref:glycosyltransferase n=1 Tax=Prosthecobacter sp. TaxID=1965333 RepID=UPI002AB8C17C|nr:glycosyltransferase [Prosthecobacter sp.]MDZ4402000.1 glycosyltransferase [Prosthecobacter sp.]
MNPAPPSSSPPPVLHGQRVVTAGKFLQLADGTPHFMRGVSYGPFRPNSRGEPFPEDEPLAADLRHIASLGFNTLRLYELPTPAVLREVEALGLRLIVGIPWAEHVDFLADRALCRDIESRITEITARLRDHPCITAFLVGNEIEKTLVRWMRPERVRAFIEKLIGIARHHAPRTLISYATYPSTEYLVPRNADFLAVNVYLESSEAFAACLARLQNLVGNKPLLITEFGLDVNAHGDARQAEIMRWQHDCLLRGGAAGGVWFAYTDEWHRGGREITDWRFGIVDRERHERPACAVARDLTVQLPAPADAPRISVIVCTRNGSSTLRACLESLVALHYPDFEILVIDDGSSDATAEIAKGLEGVRYHRQEHAGLSVARNLGAQLATGSVLAYTDDDCIAHPGWLLHLSHAFADAAVVAAGGPNIPPPPRNHIESVVAAAPGAPAHVLLSDTEAEHLPGCNLAIRKTALDDIGGFRAEFRAAGDDVDVCWRLRERGVLRFVPGAMVWHHRRFTVKAYLQQQLGYGHAEALLMKAHPARFGPLGGARWRGGIYGDQLPAEHPVEGSIFHGPFGLGAFQIIYASPSFRWWERLTGLLWIALLLPVLIGRQLEVATGILLFVTWAAWRISVRNAAAAGVSGMGDRVLLCWLSFLQPIVREWARLRGMLRLGARPSRQPLLPEIVPPEMPHKTALTLGTLRFWSEAGVTRDAWLHQMRLALKAAHILHREDDGWRWFDLEAWPWAEISRAWLSVTEYHGGQRCLTRVRLVLRIRHSMWWNLLLWFVLATILMAAGLHALLVLGTLAAVAAALLIPLGMWIIRREMRKIARNAALAAGLTEMP